jgi:recombination protein RecT
MEHGIDTSHMDAAARIAEKQTPPIRTNASIHLGEAMANEAVVKKQQQDPVIEKMTLAKTNLQARLPKGIDRDRFFLGILTAIQKSKATAPAGKSLADCDPNSVLLAAYDAAEVGCSLSPSLQLGWIIPYGKEANFQPSYRFFIQKAYESGEVKTFYAEVVYTSDKFERQFAPKRNLFHAPGDGERSMKTRVGAYALVEFTDGTVDWEYLPAELIERHRDHSKQKNSMKWVEFWEEGWRITPIRVLAKRLPLKNRNLEGLIEMVNRDTERELDIAIEKIIEPSIPRRMSETDKPAEKPQEPATSHENIGTETPTDKSSKPEPDNQSEKQAATETPTPGSMFAGEQDPYPTPAEIQEFWNKAFNADWKKNEVIDFLKKTFSVSNVKDLRKSQIVSALDTISKRGEARP